MIRRLYRSREDIEQTLKTHGLRITPQRLQIATHVLSTHNHFTADEVVVWSSKLKLRLSRATVYNTLNELTAVGLLKSFYSSRLDKLIFDSNTTKHFHFFDQDTNEIFDIDPTTVVVKLKSTKGYKIEDTQVFFHGKKL